MDDRREAQVFSALAEASQRCRVADEPLWLGRHDAGAEEEASEVIASPGALKVADLAGR